MPLTIIFATLNVLLEPGANVPSMADILASMRGGIPLKITLTSVLVDDQEMALEFYTKKLGFEKKNDFPVGEDRWLTVVSPEGSAEIELLLEPAGFPPAQVYQKALLDAGIPLASFAVDNIQEEYTRLIGLGVEFTSEPVDTGGATVAVFKDTCGNLIQIHQV